MIRKSDFQLHIMPKAKKATYLRNLREEKNISQECYIQPNTLKNKDCRLPVRNKQALIENISVSPS